MLVLVIPSDIRSQNAVFQSDDPFEIVVKKYNEDEASVVVTIDDQEYTLGVDDLSITMESATRDDLKQDDVKFMVVRLGDAIFRIYKQESEATAKDDQKQEPSSKTPSRSATSGSAYIKRNLSF